MSTAPVTDLLMRFASQIDPSELFPTDEPAAARFALGDPFAFSLACCLDRGTRAETIWVVPYELNRVLGHLSPSLLAGMGIEDLKAAYQALPRKPRYIHDAPRTTRELASLVVHRFGGDASLIWRDRSAAEVMATFREVHGVGRGLANMAPLLLEKAYGIRFDDLDRREMDIRPSVHTMRVLRRLGLAETESADAAVDAARRLSPEFPGAIDAPLWVIGKRWCDASRPRCVECVVSSVCAARDLSDIAAL